MLNVIIIFKYMVDYIYLTKFPTLPVTLSWIIQNQQHGDQYHLNHVLVIKFSCLNDLRDCRRAHSRFVLWYPLSKKSQKKEGRK